LSSYDSLGVKKRINAFDTVTVHGGSRMSPTVLDAMAEASKNFVDLRELHHKAGARLAELTQNEATYITSGASAGLLLAAAACMTGSNGEKMDRLPNTDGMRNEILLKASQQIAWTVCVRQAGAKLVTFGAQGRADASLLENAIGEKTAAVLYFAGVFPEDGLPLESIIEVAHRHAIPVIVDAAAQLPPVENLWRFTQMGADLVIFSGGKGLCGPQCSGLVVGKKQLVEACAANSSPNCRIGRACKIGKEEIVGLVTAVEEFICTDTMKAREQHEQWISLLRDELAACREQVEITTVYKDSPGITYPKARLILTGGMTKAELLESLREGNPSIVAGEDDDTHSILLNPFALNKEEQAQVICRLKEILNLISNESKIHK
jgi:D-glucosaminate-6-phosphate ammonia-lyase